MFAPLRNTVVLISVLTGACSSSVASNVSDREPVTDDAVVDGWEDIVTPVDATSPPDASDVGPTDVGLTDRGALADRAIGDGWADAPDLDAVPRCSTEVDPEAGQGRFLGYPRAVVIPFGGFSDAGAGAPIELAVQWQGIRPLSTPVQTPCAVGRTSDPPCEIRNAVVLRPDAGGQLEVLVSALPSDLERIPINTRMTLRLSSGTSEYYFRLLLTGADGTVYLLISSSAPGGGRYGPFSFSRVVESPVCVSARQPTCMRVFVSEPLAVSPAEATEGWTGFILPPMTNQLVNTSAGRYRVTHRATVYTARSICTSPPISYSQFEIIRIGD